MRIKLDINEVWERAYSSDDLNEEEAMVAKTIEKARSWGESGSEIWEGHACGYPCG